MSNDNPYEVCPEEDVSITEFIENEEGLVIKKIIHNINAKQGNYTLYKEIPEDCPPAEIKLMVNGTDISVTWWDNTTDPTKIVTSTGDYAVTIVDNKTGCEYPETFTIDNGVFTDTDGDGICNDKDCFPDDDTKTFVKGDPCDDGNPCTIDDEYDDDCICIGVPPLYEYTVDINGNVTICDNQTSTELTVEIIGVTAPYDILWSTNETNEKIHITNLNDGDNYSVTVTDNTGCSKTTSVTLTVYQGSGDSDGDGYCDVVDCAPYSPDIGGPGSSCDDGDPNTINDTHDENCNCVGEPNPCTETDLDGDGLCDCPEPSGQPNPNALPTPPVCEDCDDDNINVGGPGSPCDDGDPNTINDKMDNTCTCIGEFDQSLCTGNVTIDIYNGLYGNYGGQLIPNADKFTKGAVTLANKNDTDGDGDTDNDGIPEILDRDDFEVLASTYGRDEVDLMKLVVKPSGFLSKCKVKLEYIGDIAFYNKSTKGIKITNLEFEATKNTTVWVEARNESSSVRDIIITAKAGGKIKDQVKATAIWVLKKRVFHTRTATPDPFGPDISINKTTMLDYIKTDGNASDGTWYGFGTFHKIPSGYGITGDFFYGGRILYEYKLLPADIYTALTDLGIKYDLTRRISRNNIGLYYHQHSIQYEITNHLQQNELANDDGENPPIQGDLIDEDETPSNPLYEIYQYDAPSEPTIGANTPVAFSIRKNEFQDFARVSFKNDIVGEIQEGSRCSPKYIWELEYGLKASSTYHPTDKYHKDYIKLEPYYSSGLTYSQPKREQGTSTGTISITPKNASITTYLLILSPTNDMWVLFQRVVKTPANPTGRKFLISSNVTSSGPWTINYSTVDVSISAGTYGNKTVFAFNIWDLPAATKKFIAN